MSVAIKTKATEEKKKFDYTYQRDKDREMVRGIFKFHEVPGGMLSFNFKKYDGDEVARYDLIDGEIYTIPLGVAKHLNTHIAYPEYEYNKSEGSAITGMGDGQREQWVRVGKKVRRCSFNSLEFTDIPELHSSPNPIVTVEKVL